MKKGIRFRIFPDKDQQNLIDKTFGCVRLIYNKGLDLRKTAYKEGENPNYIMTNAMLTEMKHSEEYAFLNEIDSIPLQQSLKDLRD